MHWFPVISTTGSGLFSKNSSKALRTPSNSTKSWEIKTPPRIHSRVKILQRALRVFVKVHIDMHVDRCAGRGKVSLVEVNGWEAIEVPDGLETARVLALRKRHIDFPRFRQTLKRIE